MSDKNRRVTIRERIFGVVRDGKRHEKSEIFASFPKSHRGPKQANSFSVTLTNMVKEDLLSRPVRGIYKITRDGRRQAKALSVA